VLGLGEALVAIGRALGQAAIDDMRDARVQIRLERARVRGATRKCMRMSDSSRIESNGSLPVKNSYSITPNA